MTEGTSTRALADFDEAIRIAPQYLQGLHGRADFHNSRGDFDKALADYNEAIRLAPNSTWALASRGNVYASQGVVDKALADCNEAIRLDPKLVHAYLCRANAYRTKGDFDKALDDVNQAIRIDPQYSWAYDVRGRMYEARGELERALADYSEAIRLRPERPLGMVWNALASIANEVILTRLWPTTTKRSDSIRKMAIGMSNGVASFSTVASSKRRQRTTIGLRNCPALDWHCYKRRAVVHFELQHYDKALESIAKAVELNPGDASNLLWISPAQVAKCPDERLRQGLLELADKAIEKTEGKRRSLRGSRSRFGSHSGIRRRHSPDFRKAVELKSGRRIYLVSMCHWTVGGGTRWTTTARTAAKCSSGSAKPTRSPTPIGQPGPAPWHRTLPRIGRRPSRWPRRRSRAIPSS